MLSNLERVKAALGKPVVRKIAEQDFEFYPLTVDSLPDLFELFGRVGSNPEKITERQNSSILVKLIMDMLKQSMPDVDESFLKRFAMQHFKELQNILVELNTPSGEDKVDSKEKMEKFYKDNPQLKKNEPKN